MTTNFQQVLLILKEQGNTDEQITDFCINLAKTASENFYSEAMLSFNEIDLKTIEAAKNQEEANNLIKKLYKERTNNDPDQKMQQFYETFSEGFLNDYEKDNKINMAQPQNTQLNSQ